MDYLKLTIEDLFRDYKKFIIKDLDGVEYIYLTEAAKILNYQRTNMYRMIEAKKLIAEEFGSSKFITINSFWKEIEEKKKIQLSEERNQKLLRLASITDDKIVEEVLKDLNPQQRKQAVANLFSEEELKELLKTKKGKK
jgi:hypothetical protein